MDTSMRKYAGIGLGLLLGLGLAGLPGAVRGDAAQDQRDLLRVLGELRDELKRVREELSQFGDGTVRGLDRLTVQTGRIDDAVRSCSSCRR